MRKSILYGLASIFLMAACETKDDYDASGNFEADEVVVSAQQTGQLLSFSVLEGAQLKEGENIGQIDVKIPELQKQQAEAAIAALKQKTGSPKDQTKVASRQLAVQESQLAQQIRERKRTENLVKADAATQKQLDDIDAAIDQMQKQINVTRQQIKLYNYNSATQNRGILSEQSPLAVTAKQYQEQINRGQIINPLTGLVLTRYALKGEMTAIGKPLYKIANVDTLTLKAYITGDKLSQIKNGQTVKIRIDQGEKDYKTYAGQIYWISSKAEFTPKTIQTKNERANLVYAIKVRVKNDGFLKIGMYGEVIFI
ncbi:HlyD family secretion protein [Dyadobacter frigoris]|uniref:HlyD family efflux transporter periplasmic adaptor subunit n=1 Tax=Dyadobacter frigoris TaxID=2576211 RepID=A0A4V6BHX2_9BACT|nr:HlyD family efflux transporter periplasmic adaptor subunit [Dyadobacter frigoris]TKT88033.1 HlyD family efflux transporter periplasmic adaptor subunit [Dyadobacter frigoris]GLU52932.1 membrane protein [Dyadobacter frigoris]